MYIRTDPTEVISKGKQRGVTIEKSANPEAPETYFEFAPEPPKPPPQPGLEAPSTFAAEAAAEDAKVARAQADLEVAEASYKEGLQNVAAYANDSHLIALASGRTVKLDLFGLAVAAQTEGRNRRAKLVADGVPQAFENAKQAGSLEPFLKSCAGALKKAEQAGRLLGEARQLIVDAVHAHHPRQQEAVRLAQLLGIRGYRPDGGTDMGDAVRLVAAAAAKGFRASGANTIELSRWLGS